MFDRVLNATLHLVNWRFVSFAVDLSQLAFTCSKLAIETVEQGVKDMFKINIKDSRTTPGVVLVSLMLTLNIFHTFSSVSIVNFELVNAD